MKKIFALIFLLFVVDAGRAEDFDAYDDEFDLERWYEVLHKIQNEAVAQKISGHVINAVIQESVFVPDVIRRDKNQAEFARSMAKYLDDTVTAARVKHGKEMAKKYSAALKKVHDKYGVPPNVMLAFWGIESDYGATKGRFTLSDSFLTLIYDGRRGTFFTSQLFALMKMADKNKFDVRGVSGSWAGAMGHFQFIPTTLQQYGADGNGDGKIDVMNSVADAMASAGNYLAKLGWSRGDRIARRVKLPDGFDMSYCDGATKLRLSEWRKRGVGGVPQINKTAGIVCDESVFPTAYLTYENFYRVKRWNNSTNYAIAVALLSERIQ